MNPESSWTAKPGEPVPTVDPADIRDLCGKLDVSLKKDFPLRRPDWAQSPGARLVVRKARTFEQLAIARFF
jgi:hypothetical protein